MVMSHVDVIFVMLHVTERVYRFSASSFNESNISGRRSRRVGIHVWTRSISE
jgi:hypothetical protein